MALAKIHKLYLIKKVIFYNIIQYNISLVFYIYHLDFLIFLKAYSNILLKYSQNYMKFYYLFALLNNFANLNYDFQLIIEENAIYQ